MPHPLLFFYLSIRCSCLYHPILNSTLGRIKIDANLGNWQATESESLAIVLQIDLLHCRLSNLIQLQFNHIEVGLGKEYNIYHATWRMHWQALKIFLFFPATFSCVLSSKLYNNINRNINNNIDNNIKKKGKDYDFKYNSNHRRPPYP